MTDEHKRTYTWNSHTLPISRPEYSDTRVAGEVRMLMRHQLNHEAVCVMGRDRIMCLVAEKAALLEALEQIAKQKKTDELDTEYDVECADFEGGYDACIDTARAAIAKARGQKDG